MFEDIGVHQLSRMHYADWLDGLDGLSRVGDGESALSSMLFAAGLLDVIGLAAASGDSEWAGEAAAMRRETARRINENAWDGDWYLRGFSGNGEKVGSKENRFGRIFLNAQSWAIIADLPDAERRARMLASVDSILDTELGRRLYYPSYTEYFHHIGCISAQPPDFAMNAIYNHACSFSLVAECLAGRGDKAWDVLEKIVPDGRDNPSAQSQNEPFSITNSFKLEKNYYGECGEAWRTGTAGWVHRGLVEYILGVRKNYNGLTIAPCLPAHLKKTSLQRVFRGNVYRISIENQGGLDAPAIFVDGRRIEGQTLPLGKAGTEWRVEAKV
ncbi:MAG: N,N'-diacetylchitobiose phosphorylase [candidate division BRC1 bacterium ADurb.BinA364]|nr:MAG: N,N'-diacetylchitobiose phosphorylase [candidate division BRC1 bacterium ADurb.BinA364]